MVRKNYILEEWDNLAVRIMTGNMPQERRDEMKRLFFAGAVACLSQFNDNGIPNLRKLQDIAHELLAWHETTTRIVNAQRTAAEPPAMPPVNAEIMRALEHQAREAFKALDASMHGVLNRRETGAALFLFAFAGPELTYISNANRNDMFKMLLEFMNANIPDKTWDEQHG